MNDNLDRQRPVDDEVDLGFIFRAIGNFFKNIILRILDVIKFYYRHKFILIVLIIAGGVLGYIWETSFEKSYTNELLVIPNFQSSNFLYDKIESIDNKIKSGDSISLREVFGEDYKFVESVEVVPVIDIYSFVSTSDSNREVFELLFEEEASMEFLENPVNSMNYQFHKILLKVKGEDKHQLLSESLLNALNTNSYFDAIKEISLESADLQLQENNNMINQIDSIISKSQDQSGISLGEGKLTFADNTGLKDLLDLKKDLVISNRNIQSSKVKQASIIKPVDSNYKILDKEKLLNKSKIKLFPLIFIALYSLVYFLIYLKRNASKLTQ